MSKLILTIILFVSLHGSVFSQIEKYSTPTVWENYSVTKENFTVQMPKLPVIMAGGDNCRGEQTMTYSAYSDGVVYVLTETSKVKTSQFCRSKKNFGKDNFTDRVQNLKSELATAKYTENDTEVVFADEYKTYKLINDYGSKRWFELQVFGGTEAKTEIKNFLDSLKIGEGNGKEIGSGALRNFGDQNTIKAGENLSENNFSNSKNVENKIEGLKIVIKPRASYTDAARQSNIQGAVRLRVTFLANGGIGSIEPISSLPYGLTEQSIAAASKIFFIPGKNNGKPISVTKIVEYNFSIY